MLEEAPAKPCGAVIVGAALFCSWGEVYFFFLVRNLTHRQKQADAAFIIIIISNRMWENNKKEEKQNAAVPYGQVNKVKSFLRRSSRRCFMCLIC